MNEWGKTGFQIMKRHVKSLTLSGQLQSLSEKIGIITKVSTAITIATPILGIVGWPLTSAFILSVSTMAAANQCMLYIGSQMIKESDHYLMNKAVSKENLI